MSNTIEQPSSPTTISQQTPTIVVHSIGLITLLFILLFVVHPLFPAFINLFSNLFFVLFNKNKINKLREYGIVQILLPEKSYGFILNSTEVETLGMLTSIEVIELRLESCGQIRYIKRQVDIDNLKVVEPSELHFKIFEPIMPTLSQRLKAEDDIDRLNKYLTKANDLSLIAESSDMYDVYENNSNIYTKNIARIEKAIAEIKDLQIERDNFIKEKLIAAKVIEIDLEFVNEDFIPSNIYKKEIQEASQETKDFISAYLDLKNE